MSIEIVEIESSGLSGIETVEVRQGPVGEAGLSVSTSIWEYKARTGATSGYPNDGKILWNNATQTSATSLLFSHLTDNGADIELILGFIEIGQQIFIQDMDESANFQIWDVTGTPTVTGANTSTAYYTYPVTLSSSGGTGTSGFANNHSILAGLACAVVTAAAIRSAVPNMVEVASPANDDMIQRVGGSWVTRTIAQIKTALGLGTAAYTDASFGGNGAADFDKVSKFDAAGALNALSLGASTGGVTAAGGNITSIQGDLVVSNGTETGKFRRPTLTGNRIWTGQDKDGTIAYTNDAAMTDERVPTAVGLAAKITGATSKATPVDADEMPIADSAASFGLKKVTFANLWAWVKAKIESVTLSTLNVSGNLTVGTNTWNGATISGAQAFSSTTRPTSSGTGTPASNSLITTADMMMFLATPKYYIFRHEYDGKSENVWVRSFTGSGGSGDTTGVYGYHQIYTASTINSTCNFYQGNGSAISPYDWTSWEFNDRSSIVSTVADMKVRIGFFTTTTFQVGFEYDSALSANWRFYDLASGTYTDTGVAAVQNAIVNFKMRSSGTPSNVYWSINGGAETLRTGVRDYYISLGTYITNTVAASKELNKDFTAIVGLTTR